MDYLIDVPAVVVDLPPIEAALRAFDPAAVVDFDARGGQLRIAAGLSAAALVGVLSTAGLPVAASNVHQQPSVCCGGCGG